MPNCCHATLPSGAAKANGSSSSKSGQMDIAKHFESRPMSQAERQMINRQVVLYCVIDMRPFNTVTGQGFGWLCFTLSLTVDALRCSLSEKKIEQMMYLRLNSEFIKEVKEQSEMKKQMAENLANSRRAVRQRLEENKIRVESFSPVDVVDIS